MASVGGRSSGGGGPAGMPISVQSVMSLADLGIAEQNLNFRNVSMESDRAICVREPAEGSGSIAIVRTSDGNVDRRPLSAEAATMSPDTQHIAVHGKGTMQIFNMEAVRKVKSHRVPAGEKVMFWRWISGNTVAIVTDKACYHWSVEGDAAPAKMFDRNANLEGAQILTYDASSDGKWLVVAGIKRGQSGPEACMQLYSVERRVTQSLQSSTGCFTLANIEGRDDPAMLFCFVEHKAGERPHLRVIEVGRDRSAPGGVFRLDPRPLPLAAEATNDFAVSTSVSRKQNIVYIFTKLGFVFLFDLLSGHVIFRYKVSDNPVFTTAVHEDTGGVLALTVRRGDVILVTVNESTLVPYVSTTLRNQELALSLASRLGLSGAEDVYMSRFNSLMSSGEYDKAAELAAQSPGGTLRNSETIRRFQDLPATAGQPPPVMKYFTTLMKKGKLNRIESVELARPALAQGRGNLIEKWLREDKIECSEELGDLVATYDPRVALTIYQRSGESHEKVINCFVQAGEYDRIVPYATQHGFRPDYQNILQNLVHQNPKAAQEFASQLVKHEGRPLIQIDAVVDIFSQYHRLQECTSFLLDVLADDRKEQGYLQTRLLEMNLLGGAPQVVDAILGSDMFHHFDKAHIARLCERSGLYHRALELYEEPADVKRCVQYVAADQRQHEFLVRFFGEMTPDVALDALNELMSNRNNEALVVKIATEYSEQMGPEELVRMFESHKSFNGLFYYLGGIVNSSENPTVHFKYIQAAAELKQFKEVERVCRDSTAYDPDEVKKFLLQAKLPDPRPLIHVCDRHGFVDELTAYLFQNKLLRFIEVYVQKVSPKACPKVVGKLLDLDAEDKFILGLLTMVPTGPLPPSLPEGSPEPNICRIGELVEEVEQRNRLRMLQPWLEQKVNEGNTEPGTHNALGKIYVMSNKDPLDFIRNNQFYESRVLGRFCEKLDPSLAFQAYRRANGECDDELIRVTNENGLFRDQARYLVEKRDMELWAEVLQDHNPHRQELVDQVIGTALPETKVADNVSTTVQAFMDADLPQQLIGLLEKLVLQGGEFAHNRNLQNLLILTAIRCSHGEGARPERAMEYIMRLDNYDSEKIAAFALKDEYQLYEEAFAIYKKAKLNLKAIGVLIDYLEDLDRAAEFAELVDEKEVWSRVANAQLHDVRLKEAVSSFVRAKDSTTYPEVIDILERNLAWEDLVRYLEMARENVKERLVDSELIFGLAQTGKHSDLEVFVSNPNVADMESVGERCYEEELYEAARILFAKLGNNALLARALVQLGYFREAVEAARKANSVRTWKEVNAACVRAGEFRLAQQAGLHIIMNPDHLEELIHFYEEGGHWEELIKMLETALGQEEAHSGIFTELGVLYTKHKPDKLMNHISVFKTRLNVPKLLRACEAARHWQAAVVLYVETEEYDNAVKVMMEHSPSAFTKDKFLDIVTKVRNPELHYQAISFFLEEEPLSLGDLLTALTPKLDHSRVVHLLRKDEEALRLALPYLRSVQKHNLVAVNEAVNEVLVDDEDYEGLRKSVDEYDNFDQLELAQRLERHDLLEFRRIASLLFKRNRRFEQSVKLSKDDGMYKDAIDAAAASQDQKIAESLAHWFVEKGDKECFTATLYSCYGYVRPDVALELAWRHRIMDSAMPFMVQHVRDVNTRLEELEAHHKPSEEVQAEEEAHQAAMQASSMGPPLLGGQVLQLADYAHNPGMGGGQWGAQDGSAAGGGMMYPPGAGPGGAGYAGVPPPQAHQPPPLGGQGGAAGGAPDVYTMSGAVLPGQQGGFHQR